MHTDRQRNTHSYTVPQWKERVSTWEPTRTRPLFVCRACWYSVLTALGDNPTMRNMELWATDKKLTEDEEDVLSLLAEPTLIADSHVAVTIGRETFHRAVLHEGTNKFISQMGTSHLKANFRVLCRSHAADTTPVLTLMSRYGVLTDILVLMGSEDTVLLNVKWFRSDAAKKNLATGNVHLLLDKPFEDTMECMIEASMIANMVVLLELAHRPMEGTDGKRDRAAVLDRDFSGEICMPLPQEA
jgi:hypothetical protein